MLKIKPFRQQTGYCGPASLKMVLEYYGLKKTEKEMIKLTDCTEMGLEAHRLIEEAKDLGFEGYVKDNASLEDIRELVLKKEIPVIVDWFSEDDGHYSVVVDIDEENIYPLDPQLGYVRAMRLATFFRLWFDFPGDYVQSQHDLTIRRLIVIYKTR